MPKPSKPAAAAPAEEQKDAMDAVGDRPETPEERLARTVVLSEDDAMWVRYRHMHFGAVSKDVSQEYRRFVGQSFRTSPWCVCVVRVACV